MYFLTLSQANYTFMWLKCINGGAAVKITQVTSIALTRCDGRTEWLTQCNSSTPNFPNWDQLKRLNVTMPNYAILASMSVTLVCLSHWTSCDMWHLRCDVMPSELDSLDIPPSRSLWYYRAWVMGIHGDLFSPMNPPIGFVGIHG